MRAALRSLAAGSVMALASAPAFAAPCAGFTDVDAASAFCASVAWMKNRGITLGCTATLYCPNDFVRRDQMAAFLYRLGFQNAFLTGGNAFGAPAVLGTTDDNALDVQVNGARVMRYEPEAISPNVVGGTPANAAAAGVRGATIGGGGTAPGNSDPNVTDEGPNLASDAYATIAGGANNRAGNQSGSTSDAPFATVGGGVANWAVGALSSVGGGGSNAALGSAAVVAGGEGNTAGGPHATTAGGVGNDAQGDAATIAGGMDNVASSTLSTVGGGQLNTASGLWSTVGGGQSNAGAGNHSAIAGGLNNTAGGSAAFVGGGLGNSAQGALSGIVGGNQNGASGQFSAIVGGDGNLASGYGSAIAGGSGNQALGTHSFAGGASAIASHERAFVWSGDGTAPRSSAINGEFVVYAPGGIRWVGGPPGTGSCRAGIVLGGNLACDGTITATAFVPTSDRALKQDIVAVDPADVLARVVALPIAQWSFTQAPNVRHLGPMAQDFHAAFQLGATDKGIATVDADGVALAAIQGLDAKVREQQEAIRVLRDELRALKAALGERTTASGAKP